MRRISFILITVFFVFLAGCKGKEIKPSVDFLLAQNAFDVIKDIKDAYEKKDVASIRGRAEPPISEVIMKGLTFEEANLSFTPRMVRITDSDVRVSMNWTGHWLVDKKRLSDRGVATFVLQRETMKLLHIEGDNPFYTQDIM